MINPQLNKNVQAPFRLTPLAALLSAALLAAAPAHAQNKDEDKKDGTPAATQQTPTQQQPAPDAASAAATPAAPAAPGAAPADAPRELGPVVVRGRNRLEKLQDVPVSISVVTGTELERTATTDIRDIAGRVSNVVWNQGNQRTSSISIRGVGKVGQTEAQDPSVGITVDGVNFAYNALTSSFDFVDIDTIEVLRGPQGTLQGKNSTLGVIIFNTRKPSFTPSADYSLNFRERDGFQGVFAAGGPITDQIAWRGTFSANKGQGDLRNNNDRDQTYTNNDRVSGRVQFLLQPSQDFSARLAVDVQPRAGETTNGRTINTPTPTTFSNGSVNNRNTDASTRLNRRWFRQDASYTYDRDYLYGGPGGNSVNYDNQRALVTGSNGGSLDIQKKLGGFTVTSITAYKDYHFNAINDEGTPFDVYRNSGGFYNDYKQISQELRLTSPLGSFVDYQTGLYYIKVDNKVDYRRVWGNDAGAWFASNAQYTLLDQDAAGRYLMQNSLDRLSMSFNSPAGVQKIRNESTAGYAQANWKLSNNFTLTTGIRATYEDRRNRASTKINSNGNAPELNPSSVNGVTLGGFDSFTNGTGAAVSVLNGNVVQAGTPGSTVVNAGQTQLTTDTTNAALLAQANASADAAALKYFGVASWAALNDTQKRQLAAAQALRKSQIGVLFDEREAEGVRQLQPSYVISPSWKLNEQVTSYFSLQYGEKAGIAQFVNGVSTPVRPERTTSYELGLKNTLLNRTLTVNAALFLMRIKNYQQAVRVVDEYTTALNRATDPTAPIAYTSATGNADEVEVKGLEIDAAYSGLRFTTLRFAGAYNDAKYKRFTNSVQPVENGFTGAAPFRDVSGQTLAGSPKYSFNVGVDLRVPVLSDKEAFASTSVIYTSSFKSDNALSDFSRISASTTVDLAAGLGTRSKSFGVSLLVKNLFDDDTPRTQTWNSYTPALPRTFGVLFTGKV